MTTLRIANRIARRYVQGLIEFDGSNLFARWLRRGRGNLVDSIYVVYSYGEHWPLFVYSDGVGTWYENVDKYSVSTSKHRSQAHPLRETTKLPVEQIMKIAVAGYFEAVVSRMADQPLMEAA